MKVKVESKKVGLKLNIQKIKIMASGPILVSGECNLLGSVSSQQRFEVTDIKALGTVLRSWTVLVIALRQISVTALFYLENSKRIHP